jgi:hypothetical protein
VQELADAINSVDQKTVQNWLETGKNIAIAVGGVIAARKAFQIGKGAWDLFGGGKSKGIPKGVSDVFGSGVMPVYVVNMGAGGMGEPVTFLVDLVVQVTGLVLAQVVWPKSYAVWVKLPPR